MSTELDEAKLWYATAPDFDSYPEMLDAFHKHMLSLPQQDVGAGRPVPSPVGQAPVAWTKEDLSAIITQSDRIASIADGGALKVMAEKFTIPLFTHPPKAGALTESDAIAWMESKGMMWKGLAISTRDVTDHQLITMPDLLVRYVRDLNPEQ